MHTTSINASKEQNKGEIKKMKKMFWNTKQRKQKENCKDNQKAFTWLSWIGITFYLKFSQPFIVKKESKSSYNSHGRRRFFQSFVKKHSVEKTEKIPRKPSPLEKWRNSTLLG